MKKPNISREELLHMESKGEIKSLLYIKKYVCPHCGYETNTFKDFKKIFYEAGSAGLRVWQCPKCKKYID